MQRLKYTGNFYFDGLYRFTEPNEYEVDDDKAQQLLQDFPDRFEALDGPQQADDGMNGSKSLSKMNRSELEAVAGEIGVDVTKYDTNKALTEAIKTKQAV